MNLYLLSFSFESRNYTLRAIVKASNEQEAWRILREDRGKDNSEKIIQHTAYSFSWSDLDTIKYFI